MILIRRFNSKFGVIRSFNSKNIVIRRLWIRIYIVIRRKIMPFDTLDMKPLEYVVFSCIFTLYVSTLTTWNQCILCVNCCILPLIFRHSRHSFALNFLNNGPIFIPIEPLELSQSPLAFYARFDTLDMKCILIHCTVLYIQITVSTLSTWTYKSYKHDNQMLEDTETIPTVQSEWKSDHY